MAVVGAERAAPGYLGESPRAQPPELDGGHDGIRVWLVQTFDVAFSRRMSCSRARSVVTYARVPSVSTVSPTRRPGRRRTWASVQANRPR